MYASGQNATEYVFSYRESRRRRQQPRSGGITQMGICMLLGEVFPTICIARAAENESVCEDSQTDHV